MRSRIVFCTMPLACVLGATLAYGQNKVMQRYQMGLYHYNIDDVSDAAAREFKWVFTQFPGSLVAEYSQFYLGSYYQRKFYITKHNGNNARYPILAEAERTYGDYIEKYKFQEKSIWLSDAYFNQALIFLERQELPRADTSLAQIIAYAHDKDPTIYIYQLVWSRDFGDVIDASFDALPLASYFSALLKTASVDFDATKRVNMLERLKNWCRSQKTFQLYESRR